MASTITLQNVVDWVRTHPKLIPQVGVAGFSSEPALGICNSVIQEMLSPPYNWKFNSAEATPFNTSENAQDYTAAITDMGWLESATIEDTNSTQTPKPRGALECVQLLQPSSDKDNPSQLCWLKDTGTQITFRLDRPAGSFVWRIYPVYQKKAPLKTALANTWSPIPDELAYVYRQGVLAYAYRHVDDGKFQVEYARFQQFINKALGLADAEHNAEGFYPSTPIMVG